jgi:MinD-like ATPase involved in chromosome partitioning or flagellar assembly
MTKIVAVHSFRGGTGKSNLSANLAVACAMQGHRVAIFDTDLASPGVHVLFGFSPKAGQCTLNDHLQGSASIKDCAHDVTPDQVRRHHGRLWLVPAAMESDRIARLLREGYEVERLNDALFALSEALKLDLIFIDTHPGINEETLLSAAISDVLVMVMRPDSQDYLGTAVAIEVAERLEVPTIKLVVNKLPTYFDEDQVKERLISTYNVPAAALLPLSDDLLALASGGIALLDGSNHAWSKAVQEFASTLLPDPQP